MKIVITDYKYKVRTNSKNLWESWVIPHNTVLKTSVVNKFKLSTIDTHAGHLICIR